MDDVTTLIGEFAAAPDRLRAVLAALPDGGLDRSPGGDEWTARQVVVHLADSEIIGAARFRLLLAQDEPTFPAYEQAQWAQRLGYAAADVEAVAQALDLFALLRAGTARLLRAAPADRWDAWGMHPQRGRMTLLDLLRLYAGHAEAHIEQIQRAAGVSPER